MFEGSSNPMPAPRYFVRVRGRVQGPFDVSRIRSLRARGQLSRAFEVSEDGRVWSSSREVPALCDADAGVLQVEQPASISIEPAANSSTPQPSPRPQRDWPTVEIRDTGQHSRLKGSLLAGVLLLILIGGSVLMIVLAMQPRTSGNVDASAPPKSDPANTNPPVTPAPQALGLLPRPQVIDSVTGQSADLTIPRALGLVAVGYRLTLRNGAIIEDIEERGTCFSVSRQGYSLTNRHVVELTWNRLRSDAIRRAHEQSLRDAGLEFVDYEPTVLVFFDGSQSNAVIEFVSDQFDLAVLRTPTTHSQPFALAAEESMPRGTEVHALGFPGDADLPTADNPGADAARIERLLAQVVAGKDLYARQLLAPHSMAFTLTSGQVSRIRVEEAGIAQLQHTASIGPGNSGGPLTDRDGRVVGINTYGSPEINLYFAPIVGQMRDEIDAHIPDVIWK